MANNLISTNQHLLNLYETLYDIQYQVINMSLHIEELRHRSSYESLDRMPTLSRGVSMNTLNNATDIINLEEPTMCSICRDTINSVCRKIKNCNHVFHIVCIDQWLERSVNCPLCRGVVSRVSSTSLTL
jgi:hypothetical protein